MQKLMSRFRIGDGPQQVITFSSSLRASQRTTIWFPDKAYDLNADLCRYT